MITVSDAIVLLIMIAVCIGIPGWVVIKQWIGYHPPVKRNQPPTFARRARIK